MPSTCNKNKDGRWHEKSRTTDDDVGDKFDGKDNNTSDLAMAMSELEYPCSSGLLHSRHSVDHRHCAGDMINVPRSMLRC